MPCAVMSNNRNPDRVVIPPTMKDPYNDLTAIVNGKQTSDRIQKVIAKEEGISGPAVPMGQLSNMKLK